MILTCPNCETQYFAEDSTIGESGRTVKCAACDHSWFVSTGTLGLKPTGRPGGAHQTYREQIKARRQRASRSAAMMAWVTVTAVFMGIMTTGILMRDRVVSAWPQSASVFSALGLEVNRFGMEFAEEDAERYLEGTTPVLEISGKVRNLRNRPNEAPLIRVRLLDDAGRQIGAYYTAVSPQDIAAGATGAFRKRIENPPFEAFQLALEFAPAGSAPLENRDAVADVRMRTE